MITTVGWEYEYNAPILGLIVTDSDRRFKAMPGQLHHQDNARTRDDLCGTMYQPQIVHQSSQGKPQTRKTDSVLGRRFFRMERLNK